MNITLSKASWKALGTKILKNSDKVEDAVIIADCWNEAKAKNSSFFFWKVIGNSALCNISNENTEVCTTQAGSKCSKVYFTQIRI